MPFEMNLFIRADASPLIGCGHVMRMLALAQAWMERGGSVSLASITCPEPLVDRLHKEGVNWIQLESTDLGSEADANESIRIAKDLNSSWLVLDGYHFSYEYQFTVHESGLKIMVMDDYGHCERWCADLIVNQNLDSEFERTYSNDLEGSVNLLGSKYCLLRREFLTPQPQKKEWKRIERLLVSLGGSDPHYATGATLELLNSACARSLDIRVVSGVDNSHIENLRNFSSHHNIEILTNVTDMPAQFEWADGIVSAGGSTCWEWLHAGLPGAIVTVAGNQLPIVKALTESRRAALSLGWFSDLGSEMLRHNLRGWLNDPVSQIDGLVLKSLIDDSGSVRVAAALHGKLSVTIATAKQGWLYRYISELIFDLKNDGHEVTLVYESESIPEGDILLLLSFWSLVPADVLKRNTHNLVVHESALPEGRGWSPVTWQVIEGKNEIPVVIFEAQESVDSGEIYLESMIKLSGVELLDKIRGEQARVTFELCRRFLNNYPAIVQNGRPQVGSATFYSRRCPEDSRLDPEKSLSEQFNLLRVVDNEAYPAFFEHKGYKYVLKIYPAEL